MVNLSIQGGMAVSPLLGKFRKKSAFIQQLPIPGKDGKEFVPLCPAFPERNDLFLVDPDVFPGHGIVLQLPGIQGLQVLYSVTRKFGIG